jgi:DUF1009 family protein
MTGGTTVRGATAGGATAGGATAGGATAGRLAIIAGRGALARLVAAAQDRPPLVAALAGFAPEGLAPDLVLHLERLVPGLRALQDEGVDRVVMAGGVARPRLDPSAFDPATAALMPRLLPALQAGDDATLRAVIAVFEDFGLVVQGLADVAPDLLAPRGVLGTQAPSAAQIGDAERGRAILAALGPADVGQGCVVAQGLCLGLETIYGTDAMLGFVAAHRRDLPPHSGGVLVKRAKPGQEKRADLPAIGPSTVAAAAAAGLGAICVQAGQTVLIDRAEMRAAADAAGIALWAEA